MSQAGKAGISGGAATVTNIDGDTGIATPIGGVIQFIAKTSGTTNFFATGNIVYLQFIDASNNLTVNNRFNAIPSGNWYNTSLGFGALNLLYLSPTGSTGNTAIGAQALTSLGGTLSSNILGNTAIGQGALSQLASGSYNISIGAGSAGTYTTTESSNILVGNGGTIGESNIIRIGTTGSGNQQQNKCFIAGIGGVNVGSVATVVTEAGDQLGTATITGGTGIIVTASANNINIAASGTTNLTYTNVNTTPYVVLTTDEYISVDASVSAITIQLPNAATSGRAFIIKDRTGSAATNNITVTTVGGVVTIDGATTFVMNSAYQSVSIIGNGTSYEIY